MTTAMNSPADSASTVQLLEDLRSATAQVRSGQWDCGSYSGTAAPEGAATQGDPLSALVGSGFGFLTDLVSFLGEPLQQLAGEPGSVTAGAQGFQAAGDAVTSISDSYGQAAGSETSGWSGSAATEYLKTAEEIAGGLAGLGEASTGLGQAMTGMGEALAKTTNEVTILVNQAIGEIIVIMNQAIAAAPATYGASIAAAIPQVVGVATNYGSQISVHMGNLLNSATTLMGSVGDISQAVTAVTGVLSTIAGQAEKLTGASQSSTSLEAAGTAGTSFTGGDDQPMSAIDMGVSSTQASGMAGSGASHGTLAPGASAHAIPSSSTLTGAAQPSASTASAAGAQGMPFMGVPPRRASNTKQETETSRNTRLSEHNGPETSPR